MTSNLKRKLGQNTAEYLIMLTLIAVGSIGLVTAFGQQIRNKISMVTSAFSGDDTKYTDAQTRTTKNSERNSTLSTAAFGIKGTESGNKEFAVSAQK
jgi:Flp pilus assembly pilin Flp